MATPKAKAAAPRSEPAPSPMAREIARPVMPTIPGRVVGYTQGGLPIQRTAAGTGVNRFYIPPHLPPPGRSWEFKRHSCYGQTDDFYLASLYQVGWEHVRYEQHPGVFAPEFDTNTGQPTKGPVLRDGQYLMDRDLNLTLEAQNDERREADRRVGNSKQQYRNLDTSGTQTAEFDDTARRASFIKTSQETLPPMAGNGGPQRQPID